MKHQRLLPNLLFTFCLLFLIATPVQAGGIHPKYSTSLTGATLNGSKPSGSATVQLTRLSGALSLLDIRVQNVNLPDGTVLNLFVDRGSIGVFSAGTITVSHGVAQGSQLSYPGYFDKSNILYVKYNNTIILSGSSWR